jgi:glycosyltransferase involved in cell wall biosynthesis
MFIHHSILKIYQKGITLFIAPSTHMKDTCVFFSWPENKFRVIYNSYSPELQAQELPIEDYLLYFGRLGAEKGISTLLQAAAKTNSRIKIAGVGEEEENLKQEAKELNLDIDFLGFKSGQELANIISKAKAIVMPSIWSENMPLSLLEAMNMKKVVIASRIGGFPEIITDTENGFLFEAGNSDDLAEKIKSLARYSLQTIAEQAKLRVSKMTPENNLKEILELYKEILNKE